MLFCKVKATETSALICRDDFVVALETLMKKKGSFDYIFIECDGLADPGTVASVFWLDEALESVRLMWEF